MSEHDQKKPEVYGPPAVPSTDNGLTPDDPFHIPGTDWNVQPQLSPWMDDPSPHTPGTPEAQVPGGTPPSPSPWSGMFDGPKAPGPAPENPFTPEAQKKIKDKEAARRKEEEARKKLMEDLKALEKEKKPEEKGDFPEHQGDTWEV